VVNHAWIHQLYFFQDKIIDRFNKLGDGRTKITRLHFQVGEVKPPSSHCLGRHKVVLPSGLLSPGEKEQLKKAVCQQVSDPELAEIIYRLRLKERLRQLVKS